MVMVQVRTDDQYWFGMLLATMIETWVPIIGITNQKRAQYQKEWMVRYGLVRTLTKSCGTQELKI